MPFGNKFSRYISPLVSGEDWLIEQKTYDSSQNLKYESLFCLANGYMGNRAAYEEGGVRKTLPANYVHGVFDRSEAFQRELCNTPDWLRLRMYYLREPVGIEDAAEIISFTRVLDMQRGMVFKHYVLCSGEGNETLIEGIKLVSRAHPHCAMVRIIITPLNYGGLFEFENIIDASVTNFIDYPRFRVKHLETDEVSGLDGRGCYVESHTRDFGLKIGTGTVMAMSGSSKAECRDTRRFGKYGEIACEFRDAIVPRGETLIIDKYAAVCTGRDDFFDVRKAVAEELEAAVKRGFDAEVAAHSAVYEDMWKHADIRIDGDADLQKAVRFNLFQLMSTPDPHDSRTNIGAKLLHGEEYGGHAFWDTELFMLPFFICEFPETARKLLLYRYNLLDKARENALKSGYKGAKYPWESADTGDEECPDWTIEYDGYCYRCYVAEYEHHVTADIAYGIYNYYRITGDMDFMLSYGAEILMETARFWISRCEYNQEYGRYEIKAVTGPDEWHEPVDNNTYTNYLARWNITKGLEVAELLKQQYPGHYKRLSSKVGLDEDELREWVRVRDSIYLPEFGEDGLLEQFQGYFKLKDIVLTEHDVNGMPVRPVELRNIRARYTQINKQADIIMLMQLFGNEFDKSVQKANYDYYEKRTLHGSSLSPSVHALVGLNVGDHSRAYAYLRKSAFTDLADNQGNTREGIHAASAGGTWQAVVFGFGGMHIDGSGMLCFDPWLPEHWNRLTFRISWKGSLLGVEVGRSDFNIKILEGDMSELKIKVNGEERVLAKQEADNVDKGGNI